MAMSFKTVTPPKIAAGRKSSVPEGDAAAFLAAIKSAAGKHVRPSESFPKENAARNRAHAFRRAFGDAKVEIRVWNGQKDLAEKSGTKSNPWVYSIGLAK